MLSLVRISPRTNGKGTNNICEQGHENKKKASYFSNLPFYFSLNYVSENRASLSELIAYWDARLNERLYEVLFFRHR